VALRRAIAAATEARDDALVARGWSELIFAIGYGSARTDDALALAEPAGLALTRAGGDDALRATLAAHLASTLQSAGRYDDAMALYQEALALREAVLDPGDPLIGLTRMNVGTIELARGDTAAARATFERARDALATALGPDHPIVGKALNNIALTYDYDGNYPEAERVHREALALRVAVLGEAHPDTAGSLLNLGGILEAEGDLAGADELYRRALAAFRAAYTDHDHPDIALAMTNLGGLALNRGALPEAHEMLEGALAMFTRIYGTDHPDVAMTTGTLGNLARREGRLADAIALQERALAIDETVFGADHPTTAQDDYNLGETLRIAKRCADARPHLDHALAVLTAGEDPAMPAYPLTAIGMCAVTARHFAAAIEPLERALELRLAAETAEPAVADSRFALAEALWGAGRDRARARELAEAARAGYAAVGDGVKDELAELDAWLGRHR
jgi:tetratricopeptide (TPR) repeat protein